MSTKGIYTAVSGAMAQNERVNTISNNIANVNTPAFKKSKQVFNEYLTANEKLPDVIQVPKIPASIESFYDMQGGDKAYVNTAGTYTDFSQGTLKSTGNNLDFAIEGPGFFEVLTPQGVRLTRDGSLKRDVNGRLVTQRGYPVLRSGQQDPSQRIINLDSHNITVSFDGNVFSGGTNEGQIAVVNTPTKGAIRPVGMNYFALRPNFNDKLEPVEEFKIHQGALEASNVNVVSEMTDLISASRVFESTQQAIKAFDAMNAKLVNEVPKLR